LLFSGAANTAAPEPVSDPQFAVDPVIPAGAAAGSELSVRLHDDITIVAL